MHYSSCQHAAGWKRHPDRAAPIRDLELALAGDAGLDDRQLLTLIAARRLGANRAQRAASCLLRQFSSLAGVLSRPYSELAAIAGVPAGLALELVQVAWLVRASARAVLAERHAVAGEAALFDYCRQMLANAPNEEFHALFFNRRSEILHQQCMQKGSIDHVTVYPREIMHAALRHRAVFAVLAHNHPCGEAKPSRADIALTDEINRVGDVLGVRIADHIIIAGGELFSFRRHGLLAGRCWPLPRIRQSKAPSPLMRIG